MTSETELYAAVLPSINMYTPPSLSLNGSYQLIASLSHYPTRFPLHAPTHPNPRPGTQFLINEMLTETKANPLWLGRQGLERSL